VALGLQQSRAVAVAAVEPGSPAARGGLAPGMLIVALDGEAVTGADDIVRLLGGNRIGAETPVSVMAGGDLKTLVVVPEERRGG